MKLYVKAFANSQKEIYRILENKSSVVIEHIIKLFLVPYSQDRNHWKQEIYAALSRVPKLKMSHKYPSSSNILKHTWNIWHDSIFDMCNVIAKEYGVTCLQDDKRHVYIICHQYLTWLADNISDSGYITRTAAYNMLDKLLRL